ncbi:hypothetical protein CIPAW_11G156200 [Carya illinoinensis]|uniref:Uncharacterized protein n=1 Tax=Carya illinoinensis TaxID=32201 RepID=A0A8T1P701_CARIL|nr:hypothetical protein CIPAW_11G156200 [Carya illinoinensis]
MENLKWDERRIKFPHSRANGCTQKVPKTKQREKKVKGIACDHSLPFTRGRPIPPRISIYIYIYIKGEPQGPALPKTSLCLPIN